MFVCKYHEVSIYKNRQTTYMLPNDFCVYYYIYDMIWRSCIHLFQLNNQYINIYLKTEVSNKPHLGIGGTSSTQKWHFLLGDMVVPRWTTANMQWSKKSEVTEPEADPIFVYVGVAGGGKLSPLGEGGEECVWNTSYYSCKRRINNRNPENDW